MHLLRAFSRFVLVILLVVFAAGWVRIASWWDRRRGLPWYGGAARRAQVCACRWLCAIFRVRVTVTGAELVPAPALLVANHISWLDIVCVAALCPVAFLSKAEVRRWPLVGGIAADLGTLFIARGGRDAAAVASDTMRQRLQSGERVLFFPEGTTSDGQALLPFKARLFQAAIDSGAPVQPIAISYHRTDGSLSSEAAFVDDVPIHKHVWRLAALPALEARLHVLAPLESAGRGRSELARAAQAAISQGRPAMTSRAAAQVS